MHLRTNRAHVGGTDLRTFVKAVAGDRAAHLVDDGADCRVVGAQNRSAIKRHAVQKINKGFLQTGKVVPVGFHVVCVDIGDHRHDRQQVQERGVGFIGFDHDVVATAQPGVGPCAVQTSADHKGRVQPCGREHAGHQAGGGGFTVGAGNRNALLEAH